MEALEEFPNRFTQSETSTGTHEYPESNRASRYVMLLSNFWDEHRGLSLVSEAGFRHQLVLVPPTEKVQVYFLQRMKRLGVLLFPRPWHASPL